MKEAEPLSSKESSEVKIEFSQTISSEFLLLSITPLFSSLLLLFPFIFKYFSNNSSTNPSIPLSSKSDEVELQEAPIFSAYFFPSSSVTFALA